MVRLTIDSANNVVRKPFSEFRDGDFLIAFDTGNVGIKVGRRIKFYRASGEDSSVCIDVRPTKLYDVPAAVDIKVTR